MLGLIFTGLAPTAAAALGALGTAALVALYLLRERERRLRVAFVGLWEPGPGRRRVDRLGRRLKRLLSLLLQLALLWLLVLALVDPRPAASGPGARTWLVLVDRSASMAAGAAPDDRMARARARARELVAAMGPQDRAMIVGFARRPMPESGFEAVPRQLDGAIDRLIATEEPGDAARALAFAASLLRGRARPAVVLIGDGVYDLTAPDGIELRFVPVGAPGDNLAILSLSARRRPADPGVVDAAVVLASFAAAPRTATVELLAGAERRPVERFTLTLAPGERVTRTAAVSADRLELEARLVHEGRADLLAVDDRAFAVIPPRPRRRVLVVGEPNLYLEGALLSLGDAVTVRRMAPAHAAQAREAWPAQDVVIFDRVAPPPAPTAGRYLYLDPHGPGSPFPERGTVRDPVPSDVDRQHPLMANLSLADLNVREARRLVPAAGDQVVASSLGTPLVIARAGRDLKLLAVAFDVRRSDLPLRPTFPLLLANALEWLAPVAGEAERPRRTGEAARLPVEAGVAEALVVSPRGEATRRTALAGAVEVPLDQQGFHRVRAGATLQVVAATLSDPEESDTRRPPACAAAPLWTPPPGERRRDWGQLALIAAAALSLFEWWSHHRRWTV